MILIFIPRRSRHLDNLCVQVNAGLFSGPKPKEPATAGEDDMPAKEKTEQNLEVPVEEVLIVFFFRYFLFYLQHFH